MRWKSSTSVDELGVEAIVRHLLGRQAVDAAQAVAQPAHARVARAQRQRLRAAGGRPPQQHVVAEPAARQIADADLALRAAQVHLRVFVVEAGEHDLVRAAGGVDDVEHRGAVEQPQLRQRAALRQAFEPGLQRLAAGIDAAGDVAQAPQREQLVEGVVRIGLGGVLRLTTCRGRRRRGGRRRGRGRRRRGGHAARARGVAAAGAAAAAPRSRRRWRPRAAAAVQGSQRGWNVLPNTSPAARRTTLALTRWRSSVNAPSSARSLMMLMRRGTPPERRWISRKRAVREDLARGAGDAQAMAHVGGGFVARQRIEVIAPGDALRELAQLDAA